MSNLRFINSNLFLNKLTLRWPIVIFFGFSSCILSNNAALSYSTDYSTALSYITDIQPDFFALKFILASLIVPHCAGRIIAGLILAVKSSNNPAITKKPMYCWISNVFNTSAVSNAFLRVVLYLILYWWLGLLLGSCHNL